MPLGIYQSVLKINAHTNLCVNVYTKKGVLQHVCLVAQSCPTLCNPLDCSPPGFSDHGDSPGNNTGVSCHALLQGIFPTQQSTWGLLHCKWILYHLSLILRFSLKFLPILHCVRKSQICWLACSSKPFPVKLLFSFLALFYYFLFYTLNSSSKVLLWSPECTAPEF